MNPDTRRKILEGALHCFSCQDYHDVTISRIARQAGTGKGTVYEYFRSKQDLYDQLFTYMSERFLEEMNRVASGPGSVRQRLNGLYRRHGEMYLQILEQGRGAMLMEELMHSPRHHGAEGIGRALRDLFSRLIREGVETGELKKNLNPEAAGALLLMGLPCLVLVLDPARHVQNADNLVQTLLEGMAEE